MKYQGRNRGRAPPPNLRNCLLIESQPILHLDNVIYFKYTCAPLKITQLRPCANIIIIFFKYNKNLMETSPSYCRSHATNCNFCTVYTSYNHSTQLRWEFIKENKNSIKKVIKKKRSFFLFSRSLSWSSSCFLVFLIAFLVEFLFSSFSYLFSFINFHLSTVNIL